MADQLDLTVVGFDLGDGETAVSVATVRENTPVKPLELTGASGSGRQHITAVGQHPTRGVLVGETAVNLADDMDSLYLTFKQPDIDSPDFREPVLMFVDAIRADVTSRGHVPTGHQVRWTFGAPSGWDSRIREAYAQLLRQAGLTDQRVVEVVPESRAALLYARDSGEVQVREGQLRNPTLIIDVGSSTTDFTSVAGYRMSPWDGGTHLGARLIDRTILERALAGPQGRLVEEALAERQHLRKRLELACRRLKEDYFRTDPRRAAEPDFAVVKTERIRHGGQSIYFTVELSAEEIRAVLDTRREELDNRSWLEAFRSDLVAVAGKLDPPPTTVLLTGGASRMWFIAEITREVFPDSQVLHGTEPELAISRGLALAGRISVRASGFRADVRQLRESGRVESLVSDRLPDLAQRIGRAAAEGMTERHVIPAFRRWRDGNITTLEKMAGEVAAAMRAEITDPDNPKIRLATTTWQNELRPDLEDMTRPICQRWHIPPAAMTLPRADVRANTDGINLAPDTTHGTKLLGSIATGINTVIVTALATMLLGSTSAIVLATGPIGIIIAVFAAAIGLMIGREAALEKAKTANLPLGLRQLRSEEKLVEKLRESAKTQEAELAGKLAKQFLDESGKKLKKDISARINTQLEAQAVEAELLIT